MPSETGSQTEDEEEEAQGEPFVGFGYAGTPLVEGVRKEREGKYPLLHGSLSAKITNINSALAMNSLNNWLVFVTKACGYVQNMPAVALGAGGTVRRLWPSKKSIADM